MDDVTLAELEGLRARAYGPDADIGADPAALARLRELEDASRAATAPVAPPLPVLSEPSAETGAAAVESPADAGSGTHGRTEVADAAAPARRRWWRRPAVLWPVSIVVTAVLAVGITGGVVRGLFGLGKSAAASLRQVEQLDLTSDAAATQMFGGNGSDVVGASFHGWTVAKSDLLTENGIACLAVFPTPESGAGPRFNGETMSIGCAAGPLPALVQVEVVAASPDALRHLYPEGTGLQFILEDDHVNVFVDDADVAERAS